MNLSFKNELNDLILTKMSAKELDLFIALLIKFSELKTDKIKVSFLEIKKIMGINPRTSNKQFVNTLDKMIIKSHQAIQKTEIAKGKRKYISIITTTIFDEEDMTIESRINPDFKNLFEIDSEKGAYTIIDLKALVSLKSKYSKNLYRLLKQWETIGIKEFSIDEFRASVDVPKTYLMKQIDQKVLTPILKELTEFFPGLSIEKIKNGRGGKVTKITFTWQRVERKKKADKFKKEKIQETPVRKKSAYGEEEFQKYEAEKRLADIIETNLDTKVITKENSNAKPVSAEQFEEMYKEYLKDNGISHARGIRLAFEQSVASKYKVAN